MTDIEGNITIDLYPQADHQYRVEIHSSRPVLASKVFIGKRPEQALNLVPLMFNICGHAQARTAVAAIESSLGLSVDKHLQIARDMLVLVENAREHMFRVFVDWPKLFKTSINSEALHALGSLLPTFRNALFQEGISCTLDSRLQLDHKALAAGISGIQHQLEHYIFDMSSEQWLALDDLEKLDQWCNESDSIAAICTRALRDQGWSAQGQSSCLPLPELDVQALIERLDASDADTFLAQPDWQQAHYETTPLSRHAKHPLLKQVSHEYGHSLLARWLARLVELASTPAQLQAMMTQLEDSNPAPHRAHNGSGVAMTEAARGRLIHRVQIDDGSIRNYQILAPTEWNFHPHGLIRQSLGNLQQPDPQRLERLARLLINTIDPCVGYALNIHSADRQDA